MSACDLKLEQLVLDVDEWVAESFLANDEASQVLVAFQRQHDCPKTQLRQQNPAACEEVAREFTGFDWAVASGRRYARFLELFQESAMSPSMTSPPETAQTDRLRAAGLRPTR